MASFFDRFKNLIVKNSQQTAKEYNQAIYNFLGQSVVWNPENDENYINEGYRKNATVYSIINLIAKSASSVPLCVYEKVNDNELKRYKAMTSGMLDPTIMHKANMIRKHALVELEHTKLHELLDRPNPAQSYASWISELVAFGKLTGNRYIYGIAPESGDNIGKYKELYVMPSQIMEVVSGGILEPVKSYRVEYNSEQRDIPADQICHIKDFQPHYDGSGSHLYGQSPLKAGFRAMTTNNEAAQTGVRYLQNQMARGVLMSEEGDLNEVQAQQLKDKFRSNYQSSNNAGDVIITPKKLSWVNFGLSASDLSLIEQYNASVKDLCNIFNVPVQLLNNTETSTYNNQKSAKAALYQHAVMPELYKIRDELNRWLAPKFGDKIYLDFDFSVIPELQEDMEKVVTQMSQAWWITPNEKRAAMSYAEEENDAMNDIYVPANLLPIGGEDVEMPDPQPSKIDDEEDDIEKMLSNYITQKDKIRGFEDAYTTQEEAEDRAKELGGSGYHTHDYDGQTIYMPFKTHEEYEEAVRNNKQVSGSVEKGLKKKLEDHNKSVSVSYKKTSLGTLKKVFKRGVGAYNTNPSSVRPSVSNADQWAYARVNSFLYALKNERFRGGKHDTDLFPSGHKLSSKNEKKAEGFSDYPQSATNNAKRMIEWREKYGRDEVKGGTSVGWQRASSLSKREKLTAETVGRMAAFNRHRKNATVDPKFQDTPWKDNGYVAWNLWGGTSGVNWAIKKMEQIRNND
jgi:HK97 family phage portal protein